MTKKPTLCKLGQELYDIWEKGKKPMYSKNGWKDYSRHVDNCIKCKRYLKIRVMV